MKKKPDLYSHTLMLNLTEKMSLKKVRNILHYQILSIKHGKI